MSGRKALPVSLAPFNPPRSPVVTKLNGKVRSVNLFRVVAELFDTKDAALGRAFADHAGTARSPRSKRVFAENHAALEELAAASAVAIACPLTQPVFLTPGQL